MESIESFALELIEETLILDQENRLIGNVVLIDPDSAIERYQASFDLDDEAYIVERATEWADQSEANYKMATDGEIELKSTSRREVAEKILTLAQKHGLKPGFFILFGEEEG